MTLQQIYDRAYKKYYRRMSSFNADLAAAKIIYKVLGKRRKTNDTNRIQQTMV
jgi:hypothetical protein